MALPQADPTTREDFGNAELPPGLSKAEQSQHARRDALIKFLLRRDALLIRTRSARFVRSQGAVDQRAARMISALSSERANDQRALPSECS